jgi:stearoyl-CoA desaturase (delta-9 desaturase)
MQNPLWYLLLTILYYVVTAQFGFELGFHRYLTHNAFKMNEWVKRIVLYIGTISGLGQPIFFVCMHRKHHTHADTIDDPHSPNNGLIKSSLYSTYLGHLEQINIFTAKDAMRDPYVVWLDRNFYKIYWFTFVILLLVWWPLAIFGMIYGTVLTIHSFSLLNVVLVHHRDGHDKGYKNFKRSDNSINRRFMSYALCWYSWGGFLHNNHHAKPNSWHMDMAPGEFDLGKYFVKLIRK